MPKKILQLSILLVVISIFLSACTLPWKKKTTDKDQTVLNGQTANNSSQIFTKQLKKFLNDDELKTFLQSHNSSNNFSSSSLSSSTSSSPLADYRKDSSGFSVPDIIKIDADYTYSLVRNELLIIKSRPASEAQIVSRITFKSRPQNILVSGSSLIVYGSDEEINSNSLSKEFHRKNPYTFLKVYDVTDYLSPKLVRDLEFEGSYRGARLVGDYVYFLTNTPGAYSEGDQLLPRILSDGSIINSSCDNNDGSCFAKETYYFDIAYGSYNFVNISAVNVKNNDEKIISQNYLVDNSQDIYISPNNIYITYSNSIDEYSLEQLAKREVSFSKLSPEEQSKIAKIDEAPDFVLNNNEKKLKVGVIIDNYLNSLSADERETMKAAIDENVKQKISNQTGESDKTSIYRFSLNNKMSYEAIGEVNGRVIDQYSMDEDGDLLRIATVLKEGSTIEGGSGSDYFSNLYILDKNLKPVGSLENLATASLISAARFTGNRVYFSTGNIGDPIYIIDLSDSTKINVLGAVKVPTNYSYLLPFDDNGNKLISFGRETGSSNDANGVPIKGIRLSLFDFSDLQKPQELDNYMIGNDLTDSIALNDQATFNYSYSNNKNFIIIPISLKEKGNVVFAGSFVFSFADGHLVLKGKVDHSHGGHFSDSDFFNGFNYYDNTVRRGLYSNDSEDVVYTFSNKFLKINKLSDLSSVKDLILTAGSDDYIITQPAVNEPSANTPAPILPDSNGQTTITPENQSNNPLTTVNDTASSTATQSLASSTPPIIENTTTSTSTSTPI